MTQQHLNGLRVRPDPRRPLRSITAVRHDEKGTYPTFECGHVGNFTRCPTTNIGDRAHCFQCGNVRLQEKRNG
jgi:hypothetical protein